MIVVSRVCAITLSFAILFSSHVAKIKIKYIFSHFCEVQYYFFRNFGEKMRRVGICSLYVKLFYVSNSSHTRACIKILYLCYMYHIYIMTEERN